MHKVKINEYKIHITIVHNSALYITYDSLLDTKYDRRALTGTFFNYFMFCRYLQYVLKKFFNNSHICWQSKKVISYFFTNFFANFFTNLYSANEFLLLFVLIKNYKNAVLHKTLFHQVSYTAVVRSCQEA